MTFVWRILAIPFLVLLPLCARADDGAALLPGDAPPAGMAGFLFGHNRVREEHCAPPLVWSVEVARRAQRWADALAASGCSFEHSHGPYGENLALGTAGVDDDPEKIVDLWYRGFTTYDFARGGFSLRTGHFTQLVWTGSRRLGCGTSTCQGKRIWVCNYDPPGNYRGQYVSNVRRWPCQGGTAAAPRPQVAAESQPRGEAVVVEDVMVIQVSGKGRNQ